MDKNTEQFIYQHLIRHLEPFIDGDFSVDPVNVFLSTQIKQFTKDNAITLKQKDTFFIIQKDNSIVLGDISLPKVPFVTVLTPNQKKDGHHLIASFLVDDYDMKSEVVIIVQSKANKTETFKISNGTVVWITGQNSMRVNVRKCKEVAPAIKSTGMTGVEFNLAIKCIKEKQFDDLSPINEKKLDNLKLKYPMLGALEDLNRLPLPGTPEATIINLYLREGK